MQWLFDNKSPRKVWWSRGRETCTTSDSINLNNLSSHITTFITPLSWPRTNFRTPGPVLFTPHQTKRRRKHPPLISESQSPDTFGFLLKQCTDPQDRVSRQSTISSLYFARKIRTSLAQKLLWAVEHCPSVFTVEV